MFHKTKRKRVSPLKTLFFNKKTYYFVMLSILFVPYTRKRQKTKIILCSLNFKNITQNEHTGTNNILAFYNNNIVLILGQRLMALNIKYPLFFWTTSTSSNNSSNFSFADGAPCFFWITTQNSPSCTI